MYFCTMDLIIGLFIVIVGGCWLIFRSIGRALFPDNEPKGYVDKSVHHHYYDNRTVNMGGKEFKKGGNLK